jgi:F-type H+-transporting ATPase subunit b
MQELFHAFGIDWRLLILQMINFGILVGALWFFLYKPVLAMLKKREEMIAKGVSDAEAAEKTRTQIEESKGEILKGAEVEAQEVVASAKQYGNEEKSKILKDAEERAAKVAQDAELRAKEVATKARKDSEKEIAKLSILAAEKVLEKK